MNDNMTKTITFFLCTLIAVCLGACADEDSFTTSSSYRLSFSTDTLALDTIFSNVPSAHNAMWVYNRSGDGLRCSVRQEKGNTSGFRVNIDGIYLGANNNYETSEIEIRNKDSVQVFVEATLPTASQPTPQKDEDNLIFTLQSGVEQKVNLNAWAWNAKLVKGLVIKRDTTISSSTPVVIYGSLKVDSNVVLTVAAGTTLYFHNDAGIDVYGRLRCEGTAEENVVLRGDRIDRMFDYLPYDRTPGQWRGVHFYPSSYGNELLHTDIHSSFDGIVADSSDVCQSKLILSHSTIHNCQGVGLSAKYANITVTNSQITNTLGDCVNIDGGSATINSSTIAQFYPFDGQRGAALKAVLNKDLNQLKVTNSLITGYADDVVFLAKEDSTVDWLFDHCMLRTPKLTTADSTHFVNVTFENVKDTTTMGEKHFKKMDTDNLIYDFHLSDKSAAIDQADTATSPADDHDGVKRDDKPDIGAYENVKTEKKDD
jgi:hypothetical protein